MCDFRLGLNGVCLSLTAFGKLNFTEIYGIDFLFHPLSIEQYVHLGNSLSDCIVRKRSKHKLTDWNFLESNYCMFTRNTTTYLFLR